MLSLLRSLHLTRLTPAPALVPERWSAAGFLIAPGQRGLGFSDGERHLVLVHPEQPGQPIARFDVPEDALAAALSADLQQLALLGADSLELHRPDGTRAPHRSGRVDVPATPALAFDATGDTLWLSGESPSGHALQLYDARSLTLLATAPVAGEGDGEHELLAHPHAPALAVSVSCGQDGTWLTLLRRSSTGLEKVGELASRDEPFFAAGFLPDGGSLVGIGGTWVRRWSYPDCRLLAEYALPEGQLPGSVGAVVGDSVLLPVEPEDGGRWTLHQLEAGSLRLQRRWQLPLRSPQVASLYALPGGCLLAEGQLWQLPPPLGTAGGR